MTSSTPLLEVVATDRDFITCNSPNAIPFSGGFVGDEPKGLASC
jgi:hypothetical protein